MEILEKMTLREAITPTQVAKKWDNLKRKYKVWFKFHWPAKCSVMCDISPRNIDMFVCVYVYSVHRLITFTLACVCVGVEMPRNWDGD